MMPPTIVQSLPFILTMFVLAGFIGRSVAPRAAGKPFRQVTPKNTKGVL
jgi:simple sugar transport system permease protein